MIKFKNVSVCHIKNSHEILKNISFIGNVNDVICIIGKSGVGKTTLLHSILKQTIITKGNILFLNYDLNTINKKIWNQLVKSIGYLSQQTNSFDDDTAFLTIKRDFLNTKPWWQKIFFYLNYQERLQIFEVLKKLNILEQAFNKIKNLSQGQKQRVEIAKLLLKKPKLILADEPTAALDQNTAKLTIDLIKTISQAHECCILINIHDISLLQKISNKTLALQNGKLVYFGSTAKLNAAIIKQVYS